jgi:GNAT superfamily N-acetyltransferase
LCGAAVKFHLSTLATVALEDVLAFLTWGWYNGYAAGVRSLIPPDDGWGLSAMNIRPAVLADVNACLALDHSFQTNHVWQLRVHEAESNMSVTFQTVRLPRLMHVDYPRPLEQLVDDWQRDEGFWVAEVDGQICGYIDLIVAPWQQTAWATNLAVGPEYRRRGIATALVRQARLWARDHGSRAILAEANTKNYPALSLYRKLGFEFCGFNDHYYPNQDIALFFVQQLR